MPSEHSSEDRIYRADARIHIEASSHDTAQGQIEDWVAEHMPSNFVIGWTLAEETDDTSWIDDSEERSS